MLPDSIQHQPSLLSGLLGGLLPRKASEQLEQLTSKGLELLGPMLQLQADACRAIVRIPLVLSAIHDRLCEVSAAIEHLTVGKAVTNEVPSPAPAAAPVARRPHRRVRKP